MTNNTALRASLREALFALTSSGAAIDGAIDDIMEVIDEHRPVARPHHDTQANEVGRLTPKPLEEQVPGAWNFIEPDPASQSRVPAEAPVTFQAVFDAHPERVRQEIAREVDKEIRRREHQSSQRRGYPW